MNKSTKFLTTKNALLFSIFVFSIMAIAGIVFYFIVKDTSILFDAVYSCIMIVGSFVSYWIKFKWKPKSSKYPLGVLIAENLFVFFKIIILTILSLYFIYDAIMELISAVNTVNTDTPPKFEYYLGYTITLVLICSLNAIFLHIGAKKNNNSSLLIIERNSAIVDMLFSLTIGIALTSTSLALRGMEIAYINKIRVIIDKSLLLVIIILVTPLSIRPLFQVINVLLFRKTNKEIERENKIRELIPIEPDNLHIYNFSGGIKIFVSLDKTKFKDLTNKKIKEVEFLIEKEFKTYVEVTYILQQ